MITDRQKFTTKWPSTKCLVSILPLQSIQNHSTGLYATYNKPTQIFGNVWCPILGKPVRRCAVLLSELEEKQTELETENK